MISNIIEKFYKTTFLITFLGIYLMFLTSFTHLNGIELLINAILFVIAFKLAEKYNKKLKVVKFKRK